MLKAQVHRYAVNTYLNRHQLQYFLFKIISYPFSRILFALEYHNAIAYFAR